MQIFNTDNLYILYGLVSSYQWCHAFIKIHDCVVIALCQHTVNMV